MAKSTSRVFACWRALHDDLVAASWPPHPTTGLRPLVDFGAPLEQAGEGIFLPGRLPSQRPADWATMGSPGQNETFRLLVGVRSRVDGRSALEAVNRLEQLCDVVQSTVRSQTTGRPDGAALAALGIPTLRWLVAELSPAVYPWEQGFAADCAIEIEFTARI